MSPKESYFASAESLLSEVNHHDDDDDQQRKRVLDMEEAKNQVVFSLPMIVSSVSFLSITMVSVMFAGHLGELQLAAATLANSWATVTGLAFMISAAAALYIKYLIPGLFAYGFVQNILRFLQTQSILMPLVWFSVLPMGIHLGIAYALVYCTEMGFKGAPLAASISLWISFLLLSVYVFFAEEFKQTWDGLSFESFRHVPTNLKLALPSAAMVCLEYWAFELLVLLAGLMPNSEVNTSLIAMCVNTEAIAYMITYGLSAAASTRVSNELGAGHPIRAKNAMGVTLRLSILQALAVVLALAFGHNIWAAFFSNSPSIINQFASMTPLLLISITIDSFQGVLSGVARGSGWQLLAMWVNMGTFYFIGMPLACLLGFKFKLYAKGLWIGLICGLSCQAGALLLITLSRKWIKIEISEDVDRETRIFV
ncbi:hypothetical protein E1A91_D01G066500v1 [Gossypium mustelinum]|uniref:Protein DETOXIFICATION n=1 Tax=Gossypium mustelinum TaxID=34275 RepID=A0A5D2W482_GOSMU|nr:hypothetical protein E1A91_D01G066500v1 [Gossypium mustelinum]